MAPSVLVFDSGVGGLSVLDAILPTAPVRAHYVADAAWLPYGERAAGELRRRIPALVAAMAERLAAACVVLACNTASTLALDDVRAAVAVPVIGVVPPVKPAALASATGVIGVLATAATVASPYLDALVAAHAAGRLVVRQAAPELVLAAEAKLAGEAIDHAAIRAAVARLFAQPHGDAVDVIALACTHFPLLAAELAAAAPRPVRWLDSGAAIARRVGDVLNAPAGPPGALCSMWATALSPALARQARLRTLEGVGMLTREAPFTELDASGG